MQGVAISERAYQQAVAFARERVQGVARGRSGRSTSIHHPDVRRMLMQMRAIAQAGRALAYYASAQTDLAHHAESGEDRAAHQRRVDSGHTVLTGFPFSYPGDLENRRVSRVTVPVRAIDIASPA